jgi:hypothetical protein
MNLARRVCHKPSPRQKIAAGGIDHVIPPAAVFLHARAEALPHEHEAMLRQIANGWI